MAKEQQRDTATRARDRGDRDRDSEFDRERGRRRSRRQGRQGRPAVLFNALVAVGDGAGRVGVATGKANEVSEAVRKAVRGRAPQTIERAAHRTPPSRTRCIAPAARAGPARPRRRNRRHRRRTGARGARVRGGAADILTKSLGSNNPHNVVRATLDGLGHLHTVAARRARSAASKWRPCLQGAAGRRACPLRPRAVGPRLPVKDQVKSGMSRMRAGTGGPCAPWAQAPPGRRRLCHRHPVDAGHAESTCGTSSR